MRKWRPSGRYFLIYKVTLDISVILCYHVCIKRKEVNTMKGRMKNAIAEVKGRIPTGYQLNYLELVELIEMATAKPETPIDAAWDAIGAAFEYGFALGRRCEKRYAQKEKAPANK